jgi:hypothetical protein
VTPRPSRSLSNALGRFSYHHLPLRYYAVGQELDQAGDGLSFLIAGAAKAVCDRLVLSRSLPPLSRRAMRQWLLEDLRLDPHLLAELNLATIRDCLATSFKRRQLSTLLAVIEGGNTGESNQALRECINRDSRSGVDDQRQLKRLLQCNQGPLSARASTRFLATSRAISRVCVTVLPYAISPEAGPIGGDALSRALNGCDWPMPERFRLVIDHAAAQPGRDHWLSVAPPGGPG